VPVGSARMVVPLVGVDNLVHRPDLGIPHSPYKRNTAGDLEQ